MEEEVIWEGKIKLVEIKDGVDRILRWDDNELFDRFDEVMKRIKHEYGENFVNALICGLIGDIESWKVHLILKVLLDGI